MKKVTFLLLFLICSSTIVLSQNKVDYYLEIEEGYELGTIQKSINTDESISITSSNQSFATALNSYTYYDIKRAYPSVKNGSRLERVYIIIASSGSSINNLGTRGDVVKTFLIEEENLLLNSVTPSTVILPDDYDDLLLGGRNTALDLIRMPMAWTITTGEPTDLIGVVDGDAYLTHMELQGQISDYYVIDPYTGNPHGTGVAGAIAAKTDNNIGISSIAYNSKVVFAETSGQAISLINGLIELAQKPGIRVINCSWAINGSWPVKQDLDDAMSMFVYPNDILVVAAAGNAANTLYYYPASYDQAISVTAIGHRVPIETSDPHFGFGAWKDVFENSLATGTTFNYNDKVDISSPGWHVLSLQAGNNYTIGSGTSIATPFVTGVAALMFSVNPNLTASEAMAIIKNTADDIHHIDHNDTYIGLIGTGRLNAYRAILTADCMANPTTDLDLMMRNSLVDYGEQPDLNTGLVIWDSPDIWVRNQDDPIYIEGHQNPEYDTVNPNYVYVRVTNKSCVTSTGEEEMELYWAKANTALNWPDYWNGTYEINNTEFSGLINTLNIPILEPGEETILKFEWLVPNPEDYVGINPNPWNFSLLARIISEDDPISIESSYIASNVKTYNNIAWKNTSIVDLLPNTPVLGAVIGVSNPNGQSTPYRLDFFTDTNETGRAIHEEAEITIEMDPVIYNAWSNGNNEGSNFDYTNDDYKVIITGDNAFLDNIILGPNQYGTVYISFNFLTEEVTDKTNYIYHVAQTDIAEDELMGGQTYDIRRPHRDLFFAEAGNDEEIDKNESVTLQAALINEDAVYNWYDPEGNLIYTGSDLTVSPQITQKYKLEIISSVDGYKDYDSVEVKVKPYNLGSLVPNPATTGVEINYTADENASAYIMILNQATATSNNYILDPTLGSITIDLTGYATGLYSIILIGNGEIQGSKTLIKN